MQKKDWIICALSVCAIVLALVAMIPQERCICGLRKSECVTVNGDLCQCGKPAEQCHKPITPPPSVEKCKCGLPMSECVTVNGDLCQCGKPAEQCHKSITPPPPVEKCKCGLPLSECVKDNGDLCQCGKEISQCREVIKRASTVPDAVDRVKSRTLKAQMATIGRGECADWGIAKTMNFQYTVFVVAKSEIINKETLSSGCIKLEEIRKFEKVTDSLIVTDADFQLRFSTLPRDLFSKIFDFATATYAHLTGDVPGALYVKGAKAIAQNTLKKVDGASLRTLLGYTGMTLPDELEKSITELINANIKQALGRIQSISGKSYKIIWYQEKTGEPLLMRYSYEDGSPVTNEEENLVLKRVNTLIDYNVIPNKECVPGDKWHIAAENVQEVFDPYVDGTYSGSIEAVRQENNADGNWLIKMNPSEIKVVSDTGSTNGIVNLKSGSAIIIPTDVQIKELVVEGSASLKKLTKHHWLFTAAISGECTFQGRIIDEPYNPSTDEINTDQASATE